MAIANKTRRAGEFVPKGAEPGLTRRFVWRDADQEKAVRDIAASRFNFPNPDNPTLKTFTNRPERQLGVRLANGDLAFPDIVAVDRDTSVKLVGEVESRRSFRDLSAAALAEKWSAFWGLGEFYLFVPLADADTAKRIIKQHRIRPPRIRLWRYIAGQDRLDITDLP
jgi:hypothetical protein